MTFLHFLRKNVIFVDNPANILFNLIKNERRYDPKKCVTI